MVPFILDKYWENYWGNYMYDMDILTGILSYLVLKAAHVCQRKLQIHVYSHFQWRLPKNVKHFTLFMVNFGNTNIHYFDVALPLI